MNKIHQVTISDNLHHYRITWLYPVQRWHISWISSSNCSPSVHLVHTTEALFTELGDGCLWIAEINSRLQMKAHSSYSTQYSVQYSGRLPPFAWMIFFSIAVQIMLDLWRKKSTHFFLSVGRRNLDITPHFKYFQNLILLCLSVDSNRNFQDICC